ncbi:MAG: hypothetical protein Mars2KO_33770 [Maribacter sp.]
MKTLYIVLSVLAIGLCASFKTSEACEYAGSNIGYVKTQTQLALDDNNLNKAKFITYKAIKAIYKLRKQLEECGCEQALINIEESQYHLKKATKATSIENAQVLLMEAYKKVVFSLEAIERHHLHENVELSNDPTLQRTQESGKKDWSAIQLQGQELRVMIDDSLIPYEESLQKIVTSVNCKDARAYAERVFKICEQELLKPNLSEGKKYYNLRTQEITAEAIKALEACDTSYSK